MSKFIVLIYIGITLYIWFNSISELLFSAKHDVKRFLGKVFFAPFWFVGVFSEQGREYLFNFTKNANF